MQTAEPKVDLRFLSATWCHEVVAPYEDRFDWTFEKAYEITHDVSADAIVTLVALAMTAPDEQTEANFAAGPLEDYVNLVVENKLADEAAYIINNPFLKNALPGVWGEIEAFKELAKKGDFKKVHINMPNPDSGLKVFSAKTLMGFWCHTCVSSLVTEYQKYYDEVLKKLLNKKLRDDAIHDLMLSAPDERAITYLKENVLVLQ